MALSDQLLKLSEQAKNLEASAEAIKDKNDAMITKRKTELKSSIDAQRMMLKDHVADANDKVEAQWDSQKKDISDSFQSLRQKAEARQAKWSAQRAENAAETAESDAMDEIDFATYAIEEAEYAILDAVDARNEADAKAAAAE